MRVRIISDRVVGTERGDVVDLDWPEANIAGLVAGNHAEPAPEPEHACGICGREFKTAGGLAKHERTHDEES